MPVEGVNINAKPWPGRKFLTFATEKMKEVEKGMGVEELMGFVGILEGYKARPMEKVVSLVMLRIEELMAASPKRRRLVELKLELKMNSVAEVELRIASIMVRRRGRVGEDMREREMEEEEEEEEEEIKQE
jgi:hypothetical protein